MLSFKLELLIILWKNSLEIKTVLYLQLYTHSDLSHSINKSNIKAIPQFSSLKISKEFSISFSDMESRWRDFEMK